MIRTCHERSEIHTVNPEQVLTQTGPLHAAIDAYKAFDTRQPGWMKVKLEPETALSGAVRDKRRQGNMPTDQGQWESD